MSDAEYDRAVVGLNALGGRLTGTLAQLFAESPIFIQDLRFRVKEKASADRKLAKVPDLVGYKDMYDLLGLRVVTLFESDLVQAGEIIRQLMNVDETTSATKQDLYQPNQFGYMSVHFIGRLHPSRLELPEYASHADLRFEVQLRSVLQHAWAEIEHDLGYKPSRPVSPSIRRQFSILAAVMELADAQFSDLKRTLEAAEEAAVIAIDSGAGKTLDVATLLGLIKSQDVHLLDSQVVASRNAMLSPYGKHFRKGVGDLADLCQRAELVNAEDIIGVLQERRDRVLEIAASSPADDYERALPDGRGYRPGVSLFIAVMLLTEERENVVLF